MQKIEDDSETHGCAIDLKMPENGSVVQILYVDDDLGMLGVSKQILEIEGKFEVDKASSVEEAFQKMKQKTYDAIISDYEMPKQDGLTFLKLLRESQDDTPFVLFTGKGREDVAIKALNLGSDAYINKHGDTETVYGELVDAIIKTIEHKKSKKLLAESEKRYSRLVADLLPGLAIFQGLQPQIVLANPAMERLTGHSPQELISFAPTEIAKMIHPDDRELFFNRYSKQLSGQKAETVYDFRTIRNDGSIAWVEASASLIEYNGHPAVQATFLDITDRKKTEEALRESEEKHRKIFEESVDAVFVAETETGLIVDCNAAALALFGREKAELIGHHQSILHPKHEIENGFTRGFKGHRDGNKDLVKTQIITKKGEIRDIAIKPSIFWVNGKKMMQGTFRDITEQKKAEQRIKESEEKYRSIFNNSEVGMFRTKLDGSEILDFNEKFLKILGQTRKEVQGKPSVIHWADPKEREKMVRILKAKKQIDDFECKMLNKRGETRNCLTSLKLYPEQGIIEGSIRDITARKCVEDLLKKSEERYRILADSLPEIVFEADNQGKLTYLNQRSFKMTGYTKEDFAQGLKVLDFVAPEDRLRVKNNFTKKLTNKQPENTEYTFVRKDGSTFPAIVSSNPIVVENKTVGLRGLVIDLTLHKKAQEALWESETKYRVLVENANDAILLRDLHGKIIFKNYAYFKNLGFKENEDAETESFAKIHPDDIALVKQKEAELMKTGCSTLEYRVRHRDGSWVHRQSRSAIILNSANQPYAILSIIRDVTELKTTEEKIRTLKEFNEKIIDSLEGALLIIDPRDFKIIATNRTAQEELKIPKEKLIGRKCYEVTHHKASPCEDTSHICPLKQMIKTGQPVTVEHKHFDKENKEICTEVSVYPMIEGPDGLPAVVHVEKNITERKRLEQTLLKSEKTFRTVTNSLKDALILTDSQGNIEYWNPAAKEMFEYTSEEAIGKSFIELIAPARFRKNITSTIKKFHTTGQGAILGKTVEVEATRKDGTEIPIALSLSSLQLENKWKALGVARDISQRKNFEKKLQKEAKKWERTFDSITDCVLMLDKNLTIERVNQATLKAFKKKQKDLIGKKCYEALHDRHDTLPNCPCGEVQRTKTAITKEVVNPLSGNCILASAAPIFDDEGQLTGFVHIHKDISDLKKQEKLTLATQKKLVQSLEKAELLNEKLNVVGGFTRHDIRNKLMAINGNAYLARMIAGNNSALLAKLYEIEVACRNIVCILDFAKEYESLGHRGLSPTNVGKAIDDATSTFTDLEGIKIANECTNLEVMADEMLTTIFRNLIENSIKYGEKVTQIRIHYHTNTDSSSTIIYEDNGAGIDDAIKPSLFEKGVGKGTGYGLYLIKRTCELYKWTINETGKTGKGVQFKFKTPAKTATEEPKIVVPQHSLNISCTTR